MDETAELMENKKSIAESFGLALAWDDPTFRNQAHSGMELQHVLSEGGAAAVSDQPSLALQAARAMLDCQQLQ